MRIQGAGGVQDNRIYEVEFKDAWQLIFDCLNDIGIDIDERDETNFVIHAHNCLLYTSGNGNLPEGEGISVTGPVLIKHSVRDWQGASIFEKYEQYGKQGIYKPVIAEASDNKVVTPVPPVPLSGVRFWPNLNRGLW